jgi:radical SAM protein with 4Fe4S-binding SPASM domain
VSDGGAAVPTHSVREMLERLEEEHGILLSAGIEISDHCNEACAHCYQVQGQKGELNTQDLFSVIDQLAEMGVIMLTLAGGEATLRKDFLQIVAHARARGFALRIFTNGLTMTRELARSLAEHAVMSVEVSLYAARPEVHDFITGVPGSFHKTVAGVRYLVEYGVSVTIKTPVMTVNEGELDDYVRLAKELGAAYSLSPGELMPREGAVRAPEAFNPSDATEVRLQRAELERSAPPTSTTAQMSQSMLAMPVCTAGRDLHIEPNGELRPCTMLELNLGHAVRDGVAKSHTSNPHWNALRELTWADLHGCRDCDLRAACAHCYASALASVGDALGPYPGACRSARLGYEAQQGPLSVIAASGRNPDIGPYRVIEAGVIEAFDDIITPADDARAARLGWSRKPGGGSPAPELAARPGELVQIRRPGRKTPRLERVPGGRQDEYEHSGPPSAQAECAGLGDPSSCN